MQNIGEGSFSLPDGWHNATVNIFSASTEGGLSLTITRDRLPLGLSLENYLAQQEANLPQQLAQFALLQRGQMQLAEQSAPWLEITWHSEQLGLIHQILMSSAQDAHILNFSATQTGMMSEMVRNKLMSMLASFRFHVSHV